MPYRETETQKPVEMDTPSIPNLPRTWNAPKENWIFQDLPARNHIQKNISQKIFRWQRTKKLLPHLRPEIVVMFFPLPPLPSPPGSSKPTSYLCCICISWANENARSTVFRRISCPTGPERQKQTKKMSRLRRTGLPRRSFSNDLNLIVRPTAWLLWENASLPVTLADCLSIATTGGPPDTHRMVPCPPSSSGISTNTQISRRTKEGKSFSKPESSNNARKQ